MTAENSSILSVGAVITQPVRRDGPWVSITTDVGTIWLAGANTVSEQEMYCPKCGETRLCEVITTAKHSHGFCKICGKPFPLKVTGRTQAGA